jgi:hypothetical protein
MRFFSSTERASRFGEALGSVVVAVVVLMMLYATLASVLG